MSLVLYQAGAIRIMAQYVQKKGQTYYFRRRVPEDIAAKSPDKKRVIFLSLKTTDAIQAAKKADAMARQQDALWRQMRDGSVETGPGVEDAAFALLESFGLRPNQAKAYEQAGLEPTDFFSYLNRRGNLVRSSDEHEAAQKGLLDMALTPDDPRSKLRPSEKLALDLYHGTRSPVLRFSEALKFYQEEHGETGNAGKARRAAAQRFIETVGDHPVNGLTRDHARAFRDFLISLGLKSQTVRRNLNYISPVINYALLEHDIDAKNPFDRLKIPNRGKDATKRIPFSNADLRKLQAEIVSWDDEVRHLIAMLSDTGCRLAEIVGLRVEEAQLDHEVPHIIVRPNSARGLKQDHSERNVPLVGMALWAARRRAELSDCGALFPRYISATTGKAQSTHASNTIAKWIRSHGIDKTAHSFRHAMRDRLREVGAPEEVQDRIGGWASTGVGRSYGDGYSLAKLHDYLKKVVVYEPS